MAITSKGKGWELRNSIWMLWAILTLGFFNYISFYYISFRVKQRKWLFAALVYSLIFITWTIITEIYPEKHWMTDVAFSVFLLGWIVSIVHVFKIRKEYLLRLEVKIASGQREIQSLREQIRREYGGTVEAASKVAPVQQEVKEKPKDTVKMIDINTASEDEVAEVPGIGALFAKKVIEVRKREDGFTSFEHFVQTLSIKPHLAEKMRPFLVFPEKPATSSLKKSEGRIVDF
ncbi:helix-hairpin-helix domain-containing protein [Virgibacillus proomii]|uniref:helix-hairpin-helix domain-containing protein n=1 Tax=Virgibacillus proomii TaxID=84407 RepID=UPI001C0F805A|nr:helix-hairpin-helix domain-containing protein [Virgibacillus proomii]MBU5268242.1 helix-hairpin-helix domain-containing protein [Virgibacillus proomii]